MAKTYDLRNVVVSVGGHDLSAFGEEGAVELAWDSALAAPRTSADGDTVYVRQNNRGLKVTVTLSQHGRSYGILGGFLEAQHGDNSGLAVPTILPLPFLLVDPSNGDSVVSMDCVFLTRPAPSKGKNAGDVQFELHLPSPKIDYGIFNLI